MFRINDAFQIVKAIIVNDRQFTIKNYSV